MVDSTAFRQGASSFVSRFRREALAGAFPLPSAHLRAASILLIDVVGFTAMGDAAVLEGIIGAEKLAEAINEWVGGIFGVIHACGGDIYAVAGDAILAVWFIQDSCPEADAVAAALRAGLSIQAEGRGRVGDEPLLVRASVCVGPIRYCELGGHGEEWHAVLAGHVFGELAALNTQGAPGTVLASDAAWRYVSDRAIGTRRPGGAVQVKAVLGELTRAVAPPPTDAILPHRCAAVVPLAVADWMEAGLDVTRFGQFRTITVIFILLEGADPRSAEGVDRLQSAVVAAQSVCAQFQGAIYQVLGDEKGVSIIAAYGLPPRLHEDDAARAVRTGSLLQQRVAELGFTPSIGIATGRAFCCVYGDSVRRQFALVGPVMNLAARLMHTRAGVVLCDAETLKAARQHHRFEAHELSPLTLKGKASPVLCYSPFEPPVRGTLPADRAGRALLVGRSEELEVVEAALGALHSGTGGTLVVEGEPGIGKSTILSHVLATARNQGVQCLSGFSDDIEQSTSFFPWRSVFVEVFGVSDLTASAAGERVRVELGQEAPLAPLLNSLLALRLDETPETSRLSAAARAETTRQILLERLARHVAATPTLLVLEDLHWFDSGSWSLLSGVAEAGLPILLTVTTRPLGSDVEAFSRLLASPKCRHLVLAGLSESQTSDVLARTLGATMSTPEVAAFVQARTSGNPFFVSELAKVLRQAGTLLVVSNQVVMSPDVLLAEADLDRVLEERGIPATLEAAIVARFDRLPAVQQRVLRAASVIGRSFDSAALTAAVPDTGEPSLMDGVTALAREGLVVPVRVSSPAAAYEFRHVLVRDVAYHGMSFSERKLLHKTVALWMEQTAEGCAALIDTVLGYHFREAGEISHAVRYLARAGESAVKSYSNKEAATILTSAIALEQDAGGGTEANKFGALDLLLGRAYLALSRNTESRRSSEAGLARAGHPIPNSVVGAVVGVLRETMRQVVYRYLPPRRGAGNDEGAFSLRASAIALEGLAEIYFYDGDGLNSLYASLRMLNVAERLGPSPELARAYAAVSGITGLLQLRRIAASYRRRSLEMLATFDDPGAAAWALNLLGISRTGTGNWDDALTLYRRTAEIAGPLGERRRAMDATEGCAIIAACRGDWATARSGIEEIRRSAARDGDQRYLLLAYREQAFVDIQSGRLDEADAMLPLIKAEIDRGIKAEEIVTRQDYHAFAATLALERGDEKRAIREADAGLALASGLTGSGSYANRYWTVFMLGRVYLILWRRHTGTASARRELSRNAKTASRLLKRLGTAHPIATPSALLVCGGAEWLAGRRRLAQRHWQRAAATAQEFGMRYEEALACDGILRAKGGQGRPASAIDGLPLFETLADNRQALHWNTAGE